ncbi:group III truncated hemoglobin [Roseomonas eburnea]|uniref:Group III truncated hemoglobin n=1 Tax=Neoroseomonas eburnea TaxID=1346889 RepID=A0A9X9XDN1_9PROT|nr:group III truncated hemoglobin [Neoroseomonas eburnea]MBR0681817.1 group III truncated hemoglobin [Neoroseomonas eburnea]
MQPSAPIPEGAARRAALSAEIAAATGLSDAGITALLRDFYARARADDLLGPVFARVAHWDDHIAKVSDFWSSVALMTGRYHGQPMRAHFGLGLTPAHFARWLALFSATVAEHCTEAGAALLTARARTIASSLEMGIAVADGVLPTRHTPPQRPASGGAGADA